VRHHDGNPAAKELGRDAAERIVRRPEESSRVDPDAQRESLGRAERDGDVRPEESRAVAREGPSFERDVDAKEQRG
jgi:hypothetical protein